VQYQVLRKVDSQVKWD